MTPAAFRAAIDKLGLTQGRAAKFLGVTIRTVNGWAGGRHPIPDACAKLLRLMIRLNLKPEDVK